MSKKQKNSSTAKVHKLKNIMIVMNIFIIILLTTVISVLTIQKTDEALKSKVTTMVSALNVQMQKNLDSYLQRMETIGTLVFAEESAYKYDPIANDIDEYEAIKTEATITDHLYNICIMENFVDFSIVYSNNHHVGKMSNGTVKLFNDNLYTDLKAMIDRPKTSDGWSTGYGNNYRRIYYVKQMNENAILVISFYTDELEDVFEHPGGINDITVQLLEENNVIIYSSDNKQKGKKISDEIAKTIKDHSAATIMDNKYLITVKECGDKWQVVCSAPTRIILKEKNDVTYYIAITAMVASILATIISTIIMSSIISPVNDIVDTLVDEAHTDLLTGIFNKRTFEKKVEEALRSTDPAMKKAIILIDLDNFKGVNDTLGHAYGDKVLANVGDILKRVFRVEDYLGRLGGDEFCVYLNILDTQQENYIAHIEEKCTELSHEFHNNYTGDDNSYKISASIGVAIFSQHGDSFADLYKCADTALYHSKHKGKDTFTIYEEEKKE